MVSVLQNESVLQQPNKVSAQFAGSLNAGFRALVTQYRLNPELVDRFKANIEDLLLAILGGSKSDSSAPNESTQPWGWNPGFESPDVTAGTLTVFKNQDIPLHDHPGSTGLLLVLNGSIEIRSYKILGSSEARAQIPMELELTSKEVVKAGEYGHFGPATNNIHTLHAISDECRLYDVLFSPYQLSQRSFFMPVVPDNGSDNIYVTPLHKLRSMSAH